MSLLHRASLLVAVSSAAAIAQVSFPLVATHTLDGSSFTFEQTRLPPLHSQQSPITYLQSWFQQSGWPCLPWMHSDGVELVYGNP